MTVQEGIRPIEVFMCSVVRRMGAPRRNVASPAADGASPAAALAASVFSSRVTLLSFSSGYGEGFKWVSQYIK